MLVVDRRDDIGAYDLGVNRAEVQAQLELNMEPANASGLSKPALHSVPVPVQIESPEDIHDQRSDANVACIIQTPGVDVLLQLMLRSIWGSS